MRRASSENVRVNVICVHCGMEHCKPIGWFRDHSKLSCEGCGYEIALHAEINELRAVLSGPQASSRATLEKRVPEPKCVQPSRARKG
jgi:hypothetical protein